MFRYDTLSKYDADDDDKPSSPHAHAQAAGGKRKSWTGTTATACKFMYKYFNSLLILGLFVGLVIQSVQLHRSDDKVKNELSILKQSLREDLALQKLSENTSNAHVLFQVQRLRTELSGTEQQLRLQNQQTKAQVADQLDATVQQLDVAVRQAKVAIKQEVDQVREDMSSYISSTDLALKAESDFIKFEIAGTFSLLACLISVYNVWCHLRHFAKPSIQRRILAILIMVPVYSLTSWLSLVLASAEPFLGAVRDCYEAYIVYTFMAMLIEILGDSNGPNAAMLVLASQIREDRRTLEALADLRDREEGGQGGGEEDNAEDEEGGLLQLTEREREYPPPHPYPLSAPPSSPSSPRSSLLLAPPPPRRATSASSSASTSSRHSDPPSWQEASSAARSFETSLHDVQPPCPCGFRAESPQSTAAAILSQCQMLAMQFVFLKPLLAAFPFFLELSGVPYTDHALLTANNHLDWTAPKLYVYAILNISVSLAFYGLMKFYYATSAQLAWCDPWPKFLTIKVVVFMTFWQGIAITGMSVLGLVDEQSGMAAQNILICIEMLLASLMHHLFFPYREWQEGYKKEKDASSDGLLHLRDTLVLRDFVRDVQGMLSQQLWEDVPPPSSPSSSPSSRRGVRVTGGGTGTALATGPGLQEQRWRRTIAAALQGTVRWLTPGAGAGGTEVSVVSEGEQQQREKDVDEVEVEVEEEGEEQGATGGAKLVAGGSGGRKAAVVRECGDERKEEEEEVEGSEITELMRQLARDEEQGF